MTTIPMVLDARDGRGYDIFSRLLRDRIVLLSGPVTEEQAASVIAQLLFLEAEDPGKDVSLYINSPGGLVTAGLAILDTMHHICCDVSTICVGQAASMGAVLLAAGTKGKRRVLPNGEVMIHQPLSGVQGQATDIQIHAEHTLAIKARLTQLMAEFCGKDAAEIGADMERDHFLTAQEAVNYGLADAVVQ